MTKTWYVSFPTLAHSNSPLEGLDYILHPLFRHTMSKPRLPASTKTWYVSFPTLAHSNSLFYELDYNSTSTVQTYHV